MSTKYPGNIVTSGAPAGYSVFFNANSSYLDAGSNAAFAFGTGAYTVEFWLYQTTAAASGSATPIVTCDASSGLLVWLDGTTLSLGYWGAGGQVTVSNALSTNVWTHIAISRSSTSSNQTSIFINGTRQANGTNSQNYTVNGPFRIAGSTQTTNSFRGYIGNVRVVKGTAVYDPTATSINVPTQLLNITNTSLLTCNSPAIVDQSSNAFAITANGNAAVSTFTPFQGTQLVPNPYTLANTQGVWSVSDAAYWMSQNKWPMPPSYPLQSLRFNSADSAKLTRTPASAGNRKTWTWSGWVKRTTLGDQYVFEVPDGGTTGFHIRFNSSDQLRVNDYIVGTDYTYLVSSAVYRDVSAWYHIVVAFDTTQATSSNRAKIYVNGVQVTALASATYPNQNQDTAVNSTKQHEYSTGNKYVADTYLIDGQALTPSSFGANDPNTGVWSPVPYSGTYGTNGFRLSFQDNTGTTATTLGKDWSGQGNNWTPNNFSVTAGTGNDSLTDGPTNWGIDYGNGGEVRGNYATLNPLDAGSNLTFSDGNLQISSSANPNNNCRGTLGVASGKWYWEITPTAGAGGTVIGIGGDTASVTTNFSGDMYAYDSNGNKVVNGTGSAYGATYGTNDVIGVAFDADNRTITFYKNNTSQGTITGITANLTWRPFVHANSKTVVANFGQRPFAYPAPSGFKCLCTTNLPIPTVGATSTTQAGKYFNPVLYTGNSSTQTITGVGFQPDFTWIKVRSISGQHVLFDAVRGGTNQLFSSSTNAEQTDANMTNGFASDGFLVGNNSSGTGSTNQTGQTYVAWNWNAGGSTVTNTSGSISSQVRASTTAGCSIVTYTGTGANATVGHGLGAAPKMIIAKSRSQSGGYWRVYTAAMGATKVLYLNVTDAVATDALIWNNTAPTSTVFSIGTDTYTNNNGSTYVAYCFAEIEGFSKFGSYTGNGSSDGPFVYCGFRPRYIMIKRTDVANDWGVYDTARNTYNLTNYSLYPNNATAENGTWTTSENTVDILSNGFKVRASNAGANASGGTYIFMAFAESPFNYSRAR